MQISDWVALAIAGVLETWAGLTGTVNPMPLLGIQTLLEKANLSSAKAEKELGATFRPLRDTLKNTVLWYQAQGYLQSSSDRRFI